MSDENEKPNPLPPARRLDGQLAELRRSIATCDSVADVRSLRDKAEAARTYARNARLGLRVQNQAAEIRLRAERRAGQLLLQMKLRGGDRKSNNQDDRLKLDDLGITQNQSTRWQRIARIDDDTFQCTLKAIQATGHELTASRLIRVALQDRTQSTRGEPLRGRGCSTRIDSTDERLLLDELSEHQNLMANILSKVIRPDPLTLDPAERKHIEYLLVECRLILQDLRQKSIS